MDREERERTRARLNALAEALRHSSTIQREAAEHLISRMDAGIELLRSRTQRGLVTLLLLQPLAHIVNVATNSIVGDLATQVLRAVQALF
jgi:hypothetical protein